MKKLKHIYHNNRQAPIALIDQGVVSGAGFVTGVLLARFLGLSSYGVFAMSWLVVLFFGSIQQAFLIAPLQTLLPKKQEHERDAFMNMMFLQQLIFALVVAAVTFLFCRFSSLMFFDSLELRSVEIIMPLAVLTFVMNEFFRKMFFVQGRNITALVLDIISYSTQIVGLVGVAYLHQLNLQRAIIIIALSNSISSTYGILKVKRIEFHFTAFGAHLKETWNYSGWLIGTSLLQWFSGNFFIVTAGGILGPVAVGAIRMAQNIIGVLNILFLAMENFIPSNAAKIYHDKGLKNLYAYLRQVMMVAGAITFMLILCIVIFSRQIIDVLYGHDYVKYEHVLFGFALLYLFVFTGLLLRFFIRTVEKNRDIFISYALSAGFSLLLAAPMVSTFGMSGVFAGLILTQVIVQLWYLYSLKSELVVVWK
ncbi:MAG TPA: lipopolysaccharide biosynthesis protein [Bacteroidia bacterium]|nr:lipopolysaccharide biosynthesis protein [Bacteroidia bacterium]HNP98176.1 lipopolysaccharide biosynthesis protein [Bacteroidia bacterium]